MSCDFLQQASRAGLESDLVEQLRAAVSSRAEDGSPPAGEPQKVDEIAATLRKLLAGCEVWLDGLSAKPELNGRTGVVLDSEGDTGERVPVLLHEPHHPKPADYYGGSWAAAKTIKPLALRLRNLQLIGQAAPLGPIVDAVPPAGDAGAALRRLLATPKASAELLRPLLADETMRDLASTAAASRAFSGAVGHALRTLDALRPARKLGGTGSAPGTFSAPCSIASVGGLAQELVGSAASSAVVVAEAGGTITTRNRLQALTLHGVPLRIVDGRFTLHSMGDTRYNLTYVPTAVGVGAEGALLVVGTRLDENWDNPRDSDDPTIYDHFNNLLTLDLSERGLRLQCGGDTQDYFEVCTPLAPLALCML